MTAADRNDSASSNEANIAEAFEMVGELYIGAKSGEQTNISGTGRHHAEP